MTRRRKIGTLAALGGFAAAAALLPGLPRAQADELSDLQANQQLLQQRVDQLQQQLALGAKPVPPGAPSLAGSFPRSFLIPGTNTSLLIGGYVKLDAAYWFSGGSPNGNTGLSVTGVPSVAAAALKAVPGGTGPLAAPFFNPKSRSNGVFHMSARESRLRVETRTPTAWGEADTVWEMDFYGCSSGGVDCANLNDATNPELPRLRLAYGTLGPFMAGQNFIPVNDLASHPELFDFGGDAGEFGYARAPQIAYTWQLPYGLTFEAAAVNPETGGYTAGGGIESDGFATSLSLVGSALQATNLAVDPFKPTLPDGNFVLRLTRPWGEITGAAVVQKLELQDGHFLTKDYVGYGGAVQGHFIPFAASKDNFGFTAFAGDGLGHYANPPGATEPFTSNALATNFGGPGLYGSIGGPTTLAAAHSIIAKTVTQYGAEANYQHWWAPGLRTTISGGFQQSDIPVNLVGLSSFTTNYNRRLITAHINLIWSPVAFINTGFEYTYGHRQTIFHQTGSLNVIDFAFQVKF